MVGKSEVSMFTHTKIQNVEIGLFWGGKLSLKVIGNVAIQQSIYSFLFDFNRNYASISNCF